MFHGKDHYCRYRLRLLLLPGCMRAGWEGTQSYTLTGARKSPPWEAYQKPIQTSQPSPDIKWEAQIKQKQRLGSLQRIQEEPRSRGVGFSVFLTRQMKNAGTQGTVAMGLCDPQERSDLDPRGRSCSPPMMVGSKCQFATI